MRLTFSLAHIFHPAPKADRPVRRATEQPASIDDALPTLSLWNGLVATIALALSPNRLPPRQRAAGRAKRAVDRRDF
jgi:hypothetical protein